MSALDILVLAAGKGTRMKSDLPKVLHPVAGRPLLEHVLRAASGLRPRGMAVVLGHGREQVTETLKNRGWTRLSVAIQRDPKGSGHAVQMALPWLRRRRGALLVVYGDTPLLTTEALREVAKAHRASGHAATFLAMDVKNPTGYGRMVVDHEGLLEKIVEHKDASPDELEITVVNSGVACWDIQKLVRMLPKLKPNNAKREYYLTDVVGLLRAAGEKVGVVTTKDPDVTYGINTRVELAEAEAILRRRTLKKWMLEGVTIIDPETTYIDETAKLAPDCRLFPGSMILGSSRIATKCDIGPYTIVEDADVREGAKVGPFARLRPGTVIGRKARVGNFVETKKTTLGDGSKANHLTYLGDAIVGEGVNIGAGTITCNYDGFNKSTTRLDDGVFVGSNTNLVAPVHIGKGAIIGAGSTITKDVPADALSLERSKQLTKPRWAAAFRKQQQSKRRGTHHA